MKAFLRRWWLALAVPVVVVGLLAGLWSVPPTNLALKTAVLLPGVFVDLPAPLYLLGEEITQDRVAFDHDSGTAQANIYRPKDGERHASLLIIPGAAPRGLDDPRVIRLAEFAARLGFVVMIPELPDLMQGIVHPGELEGIVAAHQFLQRQPFVDPERIGVLGFSVGGGLALVAAADRRIREEVALVGSFGGYYDLRELVIAATSGTVRLDGKSQPWEPSRHTLKVLRRSVLHTVEDADERRALERALEGEVHPSVLSPEARLMHDLVAGSDPQRARDLLKDSLPRLASMLDRLSPQSNLDALQADVFLVHSKEDPLIPYIESRNLRDALEARGLRVHYSELSIFRHVNPSLPADPLTILGDGARLLFISYMLLWRLQ